MTSASMPQRSLRLWPGIALALITIFLRYVLAPLVPDDVALFGVPLGALAVGAGIFGALAIVLWWLFFSRAPWIDGSASCC